LLGTDFQVLDLVLKRTTMLASSSGVRGRRLGVALVVVLALSRIAFFRAPSWESGGIDLEGRRRTVEHDARAAHPNRTIQVISVHGIDAMNQFILESFFGNPFCERIDAARHADPDVFVVFDITFGCQELFDRSCCGTGNFLGLMYGMRLAAEVYGDVDLHFVCHDAEETKEHLILPWFTGVVPARPADQPRVVAEDLTPETACGGVYVQPVGHMIHMIQQDLRHMAVSLVGRARIGRDGEFHHVDHHAPVFQPQLAPPSNRTAPPFANIDFDEAVLHFRCGDLMDSDHFSFSFMTFRGYTRHIHPDVTSIGIITQPFAAKTEQRRSQDTGEIVRDRCRTVVLSLVEYIEERFPRAQVRIHNEESIALSYVRMIVAKQAIVGLSTFGVMPAVSTFGTGYVRIPDSSSDVNQWLLLPRIDEMVDNVVFIKDPKIMVERMKALWEQEGEEGVLAWFWNDTWTGEE
jgi:hypothetical protein